jgi:hypothetical protein
MPESHQIEEEGDVSAEENDAKGKIAAGSGPADVVEANKSGEK